MLVGDHSIRLEIRAGSYNSAQTSSTLFREHSRSPLHPVRGSHLTLAVHSKCYHACFSSASKFPLLRNTDARSQYHFEVQRDRNPPRGIRISSAGCACSRVCSLGRRPTVSEQEGKTPDLRLRPRDAHGFVAGPQLDLVLIELSFGLKRDAHACCRSLRFSELVHARPSKGTSTSHNGIYDPLPFGSEENRSKGARPDSQPSIPCSQNFG